ncbi:MAG: TIGR01212 family radical SAM protein [Massiliimalia sp.]|jgi:radical SAM protein (TIGR01212 family)
MNNPFPYSDDNKRYHTWNYHLRHKFHSKVFKVSLDAGFTCPNIDGSKGTGGCTYCSDRGSGDFAGNPSLPLKVQFQQVKDQLLHKWPQAKYIAYFQAHTNTYAPLSVLKQCFEEVLSYDNVVGLSIATRADCISRETADYLAELNQRTYLIIELGLQSVFDQTGERINRCHSYQDFLHGYEMLTQRNIPVCVHIIDGLPGENREMMLQTARQVGLLRPHCVKIHLLHVLKNTKIADELARGEFELLSLEEYVQIVCDQLELLPPETVLQRITGDGDPEKLIGPLWSLKKFVVMNEIDKEMVRRNSMQGIRFQKEE